MLFRNDSVEFGGELALQTKRSAMGEFFALAAAVVWAGAVVLFKKSGESIPPFALNLFRVVVSAVLLTITLAVVGEPLWGRAPLADYLILAASGVIAIAISDTLFHMSLNRVGAGINAIIDTLYSPSVVLFAFVLLGERLAPVQLVGMALVISGVLTASRHEPAPGTTRRTLLMGIVYGVLAMVTLGFGIVIAKPVLERSPILWATTVRQLGSLAVLLPVAMIVPARREIFGVFKPTRAWRFSLPGTILGSYLALIFWIGGMKLTTAGTAAILNQTATIYILLFASLFLKEPFTRRKAVAVLLALAGIMLVVNG